MADRNGGCHVIEENQQSKNQPQANSRYLNGQCVFSIPSGSLLNPSFDLNQCRTSLEQDGFQIPECDLEDPLRTALEVPSVKRYIIFNSALFHFLIAPVLYIVLWCAVFSTLHMYMGVTDYWVLCLCVSLVAIFLTTAIIFILHHCNKEINMNLDVRLIPVNERLVKHKLLVAVADWVKNCTGNLQLYFVYWDMARCLKTLTEILEEHNYEAQTTQKKLHKRLSHLVLVCEVPQSAPESGTSQTETEEAEEGQDTDENRPLLQNVNPDCSTSSGQTGAHQVTTSYSLVPESTLTAQAKAHQLLMTYSASYIKLLVSERLSGPSNHKMRPRRNHSNTACLCLCQYIKAKILR